MRHPVETPSGRNLGKYQFITGYTGGGAEMCAHLSADEVCARLVEKLGPGELIDDGIDLWWETAEPAGPLYDVGL